MITTDALPTIDRLNELCELLDIVSFDLQLEFDKEVCAKDIQARLSIQGTNTVLGIPLHYKPTVFHTGSTPTINFPIKVELSSA